MYLRKFFCLKYVQPKNSPLPAHNFTTHLPLSFSPRTPKAPVIPALVLFPFHSMSYIHSLLFPESCPCRSRICPFLQHLLHTHFNTRKYEFNLHNSRANTPNACHWTVPHIVQQDGYTFPSSFYLLDANNDDMNFSSLKTSITSFLPLRCPIYSAYILCNDL